MPHVQKDMFTFCIKNGVISKRVSSLCFERCVRKASKVWVFTETSIQKSQPKDTKFSRVVDEGSTDDGDFVQILPEDFVGEEARATWEYIDT